ncbi:hypothetical protein TSAR_002753 [Trichomalopsis sarcophagae]|uniref:Uncharacterized protein n=1 Tax=Trichomalopsis sarcophagae TaxID=543379 RepID=A0A232ES26_9HYME|nr:hypothetical protein TSAR_002753 [Trichomalopsis sarcophagae]
MKFLLCSFLFALVLVGSLGDPLNVYTQATPAASIPTPPPGKTMKDVRAENLAKLCQEKCNKDDQGERVKQFCKDFC